MNWGSFLREVVYDAVVDRMTRIGGSEKAVEIDKSKFNKRKYNRGRCVEGQKVFGGVEIESGRCFMVPVHQRNK